MLRTRRSATSMTTTLLAAALLAGCSGDPSASSRGPSEAGPTTSPSTTGAAAPSGYRVVESPGVRTRFAVPEAWTVVDVEEAIAGGDQKGLGVAAQSLGVTTEQFTQAAQSIDLMVIGPRKDDFSPSINTVPAPGLTELPRADQVSGELTGIGAKVGSAREETTAAGPALVVPYTLAVGAVTVHGRTVVVEGSGGVVTLTVSTADAGQSDDIAQAVLATLAAAG
ncbi:MAG: hypothetical protein ACRCSN_15915 [Dermatophilaceae bacterium]